MEDHSVRSPLLIRLFSFAEQLHFLQLDDIDDQNVQTR